MHSKSRSDGYIAGIELAVASLDLIGPVRLRRFSKTEQDAIKKVARGGPLENVLRLLGKFAPRGNISAP